MLPELVLEVASVLGELGQGSSKLLMAGSLGKVLYSKRRALDFADHEPQARQALAARATRSVIQKHASCERFLSGPHKHPRDGRSVFRQALASSRGACRRVRPGTRALSGGHRPDASEHGLGKVLRAGDFSCRQQPAACQKHAPGMARMPHTGSTAAAPGWKHLAQCSSRPRWQEKYVSFSRWATD